ncbi:MAG: hypothetical protein K6E53_03825 [Lachnospiraceae bacterium]|nr:hypothetical protein [Lachnospiraceae bacterium]
MNSVMWLGHKMRWFAIGALHVLTGKYFISKSKYGRYHRLYTAKDGNDRLRDMIESGKPFAYGRYSYTEMEIMIRAITEKWLHVPSTRAFEWLDIFCSEGESNFEGACKYTALMEEAFKDIDMLGIWDNLHMGDALLDKQGQLNSLYVTDARSVEAYYYEEPWTEALKGKKVLVVSPFSDAIHYQYSRKELLWDNKHILPDFSLDTEASVWYYAGQRDDRFSDWFRAYEYLYESIMQHDFDVVILACGYFGFALASRIKKAGKQAVHMGGSTQLLFGIKGKRWDNNPNINKFYNDNWIRPDAAIKPADDRNLDDGCYW